MKESNTLASDAANISLRKDILIHTRGKYTKALVGNVANTPLGREVWMHTGGKYMKESNIVAANVNIKQPQGEVLLNIIGEYMKESNTHKEMRKTFLSEGKSGYTQKDST